MLHRAERFPPPFPPNQVKLTVPRYGLKIKIHALDITAYGVYGKQNMGMHVISKPLMCIFFMKHLFNIFISATR